ncbi:signal peptidase I [Qipengyuania zhejiangensis]|uniref:signal peptidase I n=1 Tax=Qipengyuania zhejiangensis TaxID=3077782 RepID=UPI002D77B179|nr:signal peptidase I [Qipengyuania sp. Z2]
MSTGTPAMNDLSEKKPENSDEKVDWIAELRGLAIMLLAVVGFHSFIAKPFYIPSESMMPNLLVGDRLIVSKYPYGWNWSSISFHLAPRSDWRIFGSTPEYGDIVIPVHPLRDEDYIKRVVALPGDTIAVRNGQVILNGTPVPQKVEPALDLPFDANSRCDGFGFDDFRATDDAGKRTCRVPVLRETLPNGATYLVIDHENQSLDDFAEITVPDDAVFVMGDNRDHSADSREVSSDRGLLGPVPLANIGGRAEFITFSLDGTTSLNPVSWYTSLREGRSWSTLRPPLVERKTAQ